MYSFNQSLRDRNPLSEDQMRRLAPSIFAAHEHESRSTRYRFFPTIDVVRALGETGWFPVTAGEQRVRKEERHGFQKHIIRFGNPALAANDGENFELVLINSHDGSSSYTLHAGVFRMVCANGMVIADTTISRRRVRHTGRQIDEIIDISSEIVSEAPRALEEIGSMKSRQLTEPERTAFAEAALMLRYDDPEKSPVSPSQLLRPRRNADAGVDMWRTLNTVQENVIRGGQRGLIASHDAGGRRRIRQARSREVKGIDQNTKLNKALWHLATALSSRDFSAVEG